MQLAHPGGVGTAGTVDLVHALVALFLTGRTGVSNANLFSCRDIFHPVADGALTSCLVQDSVSSQRQLRHLGS